MTFLTQWLLTILILLPAAGAVVVLSMRRPHHARIAALCTTLAALAASLLILTAFRPTRGDIYTDGQGGTVQMVQRLAWIPSLNVHFKVGVDGLSFPLVVFCTIASVLCVAAAWRTNPSLAPFMAHLLVLESAVLGVLLSLDLFLFTVFFLLSIAPAVLLVARWGGTRKEAASAKLLVLLLFSGAALLAVLAGSNRISRSVFSGGTFDLLQLAGPRFHAAIASRPTGLGKTLFFLAMAAFAVRLPVVPLHAWLPDAQAESPAGANIALATLLPLTGGYGILRIAYPLFPQAAQSVWQTIAIVGVITILYSALCALAQNDLRRAVSYGTISTMGFVLLGAAVMTPAASAASVFTLITQGLSSSVLCFLAATWAERSGSADVLDAGGLIDVRPIFSGAWLAGIAMHLVVPGLIGQLLVLGAGIAGMRADSLLVRTGHALPRNIGAMLIAGGCGIVPAAAWALWVTRRLLYGTKQRTSARSPAELDGGELAVVVPPIILGAILGIFGQTVCLGLVQSAARAIEKLMSAG